MNHRRKRQKVQVFSLRIVTSIVGETTRVSSEKHGCFGNFVYFSDLSFFLWLSTSLYNITTVTEHLKRQPTLQAMIQNQISKQ